MMTRWAKLIDDRGMPSKICLIRTALKESGYAKEFLVRREESGRFWPAFFIMGFLFASFMHLFFWLWFGRGTDSFLSPLYLGVFAFGFVFYGGSMGIVNKLYGWRSSRHARQAMLRAGLCPGCGYSICDLQPEPDGCTVCPECGGAWLLKSTHTEK